MSRIIHSLVKNTNDFNTIFDKNVENQMLVNAVTKQSGHNFFVFLVQIGRVVSNFLAGFHQLMIVKIGLVFRPGLKRVQPDGIQVFDSFIG